MCSLDEFRVAKVMKLVMLPMMLHNFFFKVNCKTVHTTGDYIDMIHCDWYSNYDKLETHHGFIQWYRLRVYMNFKNS